MSIENYLKALGLGQIHTREAVIGGKAVTLYARELSANEVAGLLDGLRDEQGLLRPGETTVLRNRIVAASICDEHGLPQVPAEEVGALPFVLVKPLADFVFEVNSLYDASENEEKKG